MADTKTSLTLTAGYGGTDFTRKYSFDGLSTADLTDAKSHILAINASLAGGTDGGLGTFFRSDDFDDADPQNVIGNFTAITAARVSVTTETPINLND